MTSWSRTWMLLGVLLFPAWCWATTYTAATCGSVDVQAQIDLATDGDTVQIPSGSCSWSGPVGWANKNVVVQGAGSGVTTITHAAQAFYIAITDASKGAYRLTAMTLTGTGGPAIQMISTTLAATSCCWRIDHIHFDYKYGDFFNTLFIGGNNYGLIDHNTFDESAGVSIDMSMRLERESNDFATYGPEGAFNFAQPAAFGTQNFIVVEDNTFTFVESQTGATIIFDTNSGGGRIVFRHNTVTGGFLYAHWVRGAMNCHITFEIYNNVFAPNSRYDAYFARFQSGTGLIYNNTITMNAPNDPYIVIDEYRGGGNESTNPLGACDGTKSWDGNLGETAPGWPCLGQIGRGGGVTWANLLTGTQQNSNPLYMWNNGTQSGCATGGSCTDSGAIFVDTPYANLIKTTAHSNGQKDYVVGTAMPGYTAYTYPHPLTVAAPTTRGNVHPGRGKKWR